MALTSVFFCYWKMLTYILPHRNKGKDRARFVHILRPKIYWKKCPPNSTNILSIKNSNILITCDVAHQRQGEHFPLLGVRRPSTVVRRPLTFPILIFSFVTAKSNELKLGKKHLLKVLYYDCSFPADPFTNIAALGISCLGLVDF
jgi:hypothetical protein